MNFYPSKDHSLSLSLSIFLFLFFSFNRYGLLDSLGHFVSCLWCSWIFMFAPIVKWPLLLFLLFLVQIRILLPWASVTFVRNLVLCFVREHLLNRGSTGCECRHRTNSFCVQGSFERLYCRWNRLGEREREREDPFFLSHYRCILFSLSLSPGLLFFLCFCFVTCIHKSIHLKSCVWLAVSKRFFICLLLMILSTVATVCPQLLRLFICPLVFSSVESTYECVCPCAPPCSASFLCPLSLSLRVVCPVSQCFLCYFFISPFSFHSLSIRWCVKWHNKRKRIAQGSNVSPSWSLLDKDRIYIFFLCSFTYRLNSRQLAVVHFYLVPSLVCG